MNPELVITFDTAGTGRCLYSEVIDLSQLGALAISRATRIEYDNNAQMWRVYDMTGFPMFSASTRGQCLDWERLYFNRKEMPT